MGIDSLKCSKCGLEFTLTGDVLNADLRCSPNQDPKICKEYPSAALPVLCSKIQESVRIKFENAK